MHVLFLMRLGTSYFPKHSTCLLEACLDLVQELYRVSRYNFNFCVQIIPKEYVRCLKGEIPGEINLETRNRDSYTIKVAKYKEKHVLTAGWPQFVENFHLQLGDSLLFRYNGDSLFSIIIFDKLGREEASFVLVDPFPPQVQGRHNETG